MPWAQEVRGSNPRAPTKTRSVSQQGRPVTLPVRAPTSFLRHTPLGIESVAVLTHRIAGEQRGNRPVRGSVVASHLMVIVVTDSLQLDESGYRPRVGPKSPIIGNLRSALLPLSPPVGIGDGDGAERGFPSPGGHRESSDPNSVARNAGGGFWNSWSI